MQERWTLEKSRERIMNRHNWMVSVMCGCEHTIGNGQFARLPTRAIAGAVEPESKYEEQTKRMHGSVLYQWEREKKVGDQPRRSALIRSRPLPDACKMQTDAIPLPPLETYPAVSAQCYARLGNHLPHPSHGPPIPPSDCCLVVGNCQPRDEKSRFSFKKEKEEAVISGANCCVLWLPETLEFISTHYQIHSIMDNVTTHVHGACIN
ncbi:hypothetical protein QBC38DRAFT_47743 [Podospora fimiseda]|uniref:Uncharacterized protein n=1 Tax=Podospora fimiseda TaxID=252190 RepID=A0AAN7H3T9_9PEZI|nr:hypothetical protein QBC38DRAFT_47743 [Podospora fimiseda]